jgi:hypothetical protein
MADDHNKHVRGAFVRLVGILADRELEDEHERAAALFRLSLPERWVGLLEWWAEIIPALLEEQQPAMRAAHQQNVRAAMADPGGVAPSYPALLALILVHGHGDRLLPPRGHQWSCTWRRAGFRASALPA